MDEASHTGGVQSVKKAFSLLNCFARAHRPLSLKELSEMTGWAKSTVHGLLTAMREAGAVAQDDRDGKYRLGTCLFELGNAASKQWDILDLSKPLLQRLCDLTGESVCLAMFDETSVLVLDCVDAGSPLRIVTNIGSRLPLHASALGKAMLSGFTPSRAAAILQSAGMTPYTPHTIITAADMDAELMRIRAEGCAVENGELRVGMRAVAAPITDYYGTSRYAVGVTGMFRRVTDDEFLKAKELVCSAAGEISALICGKQT